MRIVAFVGYSGSGKTTLIEGLIPRFIRAGQHVSVIKHAHHGFDLDRPGKDSYRHREAGAREVLITTERRWALLHELQGEAEPDLSAHIRRLAPCDWVLIEGFKQEPVAKIEVHRSERGGDWLYPNDARILAVVTNLGPIADRPYFAPEDGEGIFSFLQERIPEHVS
jgi:molybdopterin-guanine dinucleotide biosynthesis protein B